MNLRDTGKVLAKIRERWSPGGFDKATKFVDNFQPTSNVLDCSVLPLHQADRKLLMMGSMQQ